MLERLRRKAAAIEAELRRMLADAGEAGLSTEQRAAYDAKRAEFDQILTTIRSHEELERQSRGLRAAADPPEDPVPDDEDEDDDDSEDEDDDEEGGEGRSRGRRVARVHDRRSDRRFATFGEQLRAVMAACLPGGTVDPRLALAPTDQRAGTGMSEGVPSDGGFLVQQDFATEILKRIYATGSILSRVRRIPISANSNGLAINAIDETSRATGSRLGGVRAYWLAEAGQKQASAPKFRRMELRLQKIAALFYATDELLEDTTALPVTLEQAAGDEIRFEVEDAIFRGNGVGKPLGILNSPAFITQAAEGGQAVDTVVLNNILKMWARLWSRSRENVVWLINQAILPQLAGLTLGGYPIYIPPGGMVGNPFSTLMGRPVIEVEQGSALGDVGDIVLVDLNEYLLIDKGGIKSASSIHVRFLYDETAFRFVYRVDGQPIWNSPLTPFKGADTLSPFVGLAAR